MFTYLLSIKIFFCLLQLRSYINETLLDQLPLLVELQRFLEHLSIMETPSVKKELVLEQVTIVEKSFVI